MQTPPGQRSIRNNKHKNISNNNNNNEQSRRVHN